MSPRNTLYQSIGAAAGIAAPLLAFTCILTAIASYPAFSWTNNALSDLGVIPGITSLLFNFGLIVSGSFSFTFSVLGLYVFLRASWAGKIGSAVFAAANLALMSIGIFNENFSPTHYLVSVAFFTLAISLFILSARFCPLSTRRQFPVLCRHRSSMPWLRDSIIFKRCGSREFLSVCCFSGQL
jgi:hypothetical membrane protein